MNLKMKIKKAEIEDIPQIIELMREFAEYENLTQFFEVTEENLYDAMFGDDSFVEGLIAFDDVTPVAYAICFPYFSSFRGQKSVYLEDIFIKEKYRKTGLGGKMLRKIAQIGKKSGALRMDFQVLDWNTPAINFYKKHGAAFNDDERRAKFTGEAFEKLASE